MWQYDHNNTERSKFHFGLEALPLILITTTPSLTSHFVVSCRTCTQDNGNQEIKLHFTACQVHIPQESLMKTSGWSFFSSHQYHENSQIHKCFCGKRREIPPGWQHSDRRGKQFQGQFLVPNIIQMEEAMHSHICGASPTGICDSISVLKSYHVISVSIPPRKGNTLETVSFQKELSSFLGGMSDVSYDTAGTGKAKQGLAEDMALHHHSGKT